MLEYAAACLMGWIILPSWRQKRRHIHTIFDDGISINACSASLRYYEKRQTVNTPYHMQSASAFDRRLQSPYASGDLLFDRLGDEDA